MNREEIVRMAHDAGCGWAQNGTEPVLMGEEQITRFAAIVADAEREACAKVCEGSLIVEINPERSTALEKHLLMEGAKAGIKTAASAIRARGDK